MKLRGYGFRHRPIVAVDFDAGLPVRYRGGYCCVVFGGASGNNRSNAGVK